LYWPVSDQSTLHKAKESRDAKEERQKEEKELKQDEAMIKKEERERKAARKIEAKGGRKSSPGGNKNGHKQKQRYGRAGSARCRPSKRVDSFVFHFSFFKSGQFSTFCTLPPAGRVLEAVDVRAQIHGSNG
jgi:ATPase subunit of ABC transporter with duplicated ATPase domains